MSISKAVKGLVEYELYAEDGDETRRVDDQSLLLQNLKSLLPGPGIRISEPTTEIGASRVVCLESSAENSNTEINKLFNFKDFIESFNSFTSANLSGLVPYIQIYKIYPDESDSEKKIKEIVFNNFYPKNAIESITSAGSDRGFQASLKSVHLASQGKDPATMYLYDLKFKFAFDSIGALFNEESNYTELFNPPKKLQEKKRKDANPKYYKLYLKFGWKANLDVDPNLSKFADASKGELFINYIKHTLNILEDGSVDLDIEYIGSLDAEARNQNNISILNSNDTERLKFLEKNISNLKEVIKNRYINCNITEDLDTTTEKYDVKFFKPDGDEIDDKTSDNLKNSLKQSLDEKYLIETKGTDKFLEKILDNLIKSYGGGLPIISFKLSDINKRFKIINDYNQGPLTPSSPGLGSFVIPLQDRADSIINIINAGTLQPGTGLSNAIGTGTISKFTKTQYNIKDIYEYLFLQDTNIGKDAYGNVDFTDPASRYNIYYFTFGAFIKALELDESFLFVGCDVPINYFDASKGGLGTIYKAKYDIEKPDNAYIFENQIRYCNVFDIPISLSTFKVWFNKNITSGKVSSMSINTFLNLCINDLLISAIQPTNEDFFPQQNIRFKYFYDRTRINKDNPLLTAESYTYLQNSPTNFIKIAKTSPIKRTQSNEGIELLSIIDNQSTLEKNLVIFYCLPKFFNRKRDSAEDLKSCIPSFYYGAKNSIVNKISFKESTIPYLKESSIQRQVKGTNWKPGILLRGLYNVTLECIGLTNFRPGSIIYVAPTFTGLKNISDALNIGIGGYFMIVSLNIIIESGKYITNIEASWIGDGTGNTRNLDGEQIKIIRTYSAASTTIENSDTISPTTVNNIKI